MCKEMDVKDFRGGGARKGTEGHLEHTCRLFALLFSAPPSSCRGDDTPSSDCRCDSLPCTENPAVSSLINYTFMPKLKAKTLSQQLSPFLQYSRLTFSFRLRKILMRSQTGHGLFAANNMMA